MSRQYYPTPPTVLYPHGVGAALSDLIRTCHTVRLEPPIPHPILHGLHDAASQEPFSFASLLKNRQTKLQTMFDSHNAGYLTDTSNRHNTASHNPTNGTDASSYAYQAPSLPSTETPNSRGNPIDIGTDPSDINVHNRESESPGPSSYITLSAGLMQERRTSIISAITTRNNPSALSGVDQKFVRRYRPRLAPPVSWQPEHTQALDDHLQTQTNYTKSLLRAVCNPTERNVDRVQPSLRPFISCVRSDHQERLRQYGPENARAVRIVTEGLCSEVVRDVA
jgi:hypothetical protein